MAERLLFDIYIAYLEHFPDLVDQRSGKNRQVFLKYLQGVEQRETLKVSQDDTIAEQPRYPLHRLMEPGAAYADLDIRYKGLENIPREGGVVFAVNHYNRWKQSGTAWVAVSVASAVSAARNGEDCPFIMEADTGSPLEKFYAKFPAIKKLALDKQQNLLGQSLKLLNNYLHDATMHGHKNVAAVAGLILTTDQKAILQRLKSGKAVGIFPAATAEYSLKRADPRSGTLSRLATKYGAPTVAVAVYHNRKKQQGYVSFGKPVLYPGDTGNGRTIADTIQGEIARQLPPSMRGYYSEVASPTSTCESVLYLGNAKPHS